jgi:ribosome-associated translation inhibitor RaiA
VGAHALTAPVRKTPISLKSSQEPIVQTPLQLDAQGPTLTQNAWAVIRANLSKLENRFGKLTACRLVIRPPSSRQRLGSRFAVSIHLSLPNGREVNVGTVHRTYDPRHADLLFALHDAFRKAVRQLQRQVAHMRIEPRRKGESRA